MSFQKKDYFWDCPKLISVTTQVQPQRWAYCWNFAWLLSAVSNEYPDLGLFWWGNCEILSQDNHVEFCSVMYEPCQKTCLITCGTRDSYFWHGMCSVVRVCCSLGFWGQWQLILARYALSMVRVYCSLGFWGLWQLILARYAHSVVRGFGGPGLDGKIDSSFYTV